MVHFFWLWSTILRVAYSVQLAAAVHLGRFRQMYGRWVTFNESYDFARAGACCFRFPIVEDDARSNE